jgi:hypothetical protein
MSTTMPFALGEREEKETTAPDAALVRLMPSGPMVRLGDGQGEAPGSPAAPFARFAAKTSYPSFGGEGPVTFASEPTDTAIYTGIYIDSYKMDDH